MIDTLEIRDFRGIRHLEVTDLGRVNLVIGHNSSGKTTVAAAAMMADDIHHWLFFSPFLVDPRPDRKPDLDVLTQLLPGLDRDRQPTITVTRGGNPTFARLELQSRVLSIPEVTFTVNGERHTVLAESGHWVSETVSEKAGSYAWVPAFVEAEGRILEMVVRRYKAGSMQAVVDAARVVDPTLTHIDPVGTKIFVRLEDSPLPMPYGVLGDGARRLIEIALSIPSERVGIDELENGFHHSTLPTVIEMLRLAPDGTQIFATTHREELIRMACEQFIAADDDSLRIVRIDRDGDTHSAVVYTAEQALAGMEAGLEIRG